MVNAVAIQRYELIFVIISGKISVDFATLLVYFKHFYMRN